jgi:predicted Zn-ribbon and HTH transcriptional regulator
MVKKLERLNCKRCGYSWVARKLNVVACPKCKSYFWQSDRKIKSEARED